MEELLHPALSGRFIQPRFIGDYPRHKNLLEDVGSFERRPHEFYVAVTSRDKLATLEILGYATRHEMGERKPISFGYEVLNRYVPLDRLHPFAELDHLPRSTSRAQSDSHYVLGFVGGRLHFCPADLLGGQVVERPSGLLAPQHAVLRQFKDQFGGFTQDEIDELNDLLNSATAAEADFHAYLRWVAEHPWAYVINCYRQPTRDYLVLHRATCETIRGRPARGETWTCSTYSKVCAAETATLNRWALETLHTLPTPYRQCRP